MDGKKSSIELKYVSNILLLASPPIFFCFELGIGVNRTDIDSANSPYPTISTEQVYVPSGLNFHM